MQMTDSNDGKPSVLKSTREARGLTLEIVHEATKIPMDALRAIEEGYSVRILSPFYYRGFIKIYAEFLGLNVAEMYKQYGLDQPQPQAKGVPAATAPVKSARKPATPQAPNVFLEQVQEWFSVAFKPKNLKVIFKILVSLAAVFFLFRTAGCVVAHMHKKPAPSKKHFALSRPEQKAETHKVIPIEKEEAPSPAPAVVKHEALQAQSVNDKVEVAVRANRNTYLQVKTDGRVVFQTSLSKGSLETWSADERIEISGKNIDQLDWEVNGRHIGSLGEGERRVRKVLITREGLTVKK